MKYAVAIDIGGTNTRVALIDETYRIISRVQFPTDADNPEAVLNRIAETIEQTDVEIQGIGMSCPGPLDIPHQKVLNPPNLHGRWHGLAITEPLQKRFNVPVYLENDANLAALAEAVIGEGKEYSVVQYITVSTGIGAGLVINRNIFDGAHGFANEVANTCMINNGPQHGDLIPGGIEAICSGTAIEKRARVKGMSPRHAGDVNDLAKAGNKDAQEIMNDAVTYLANYIAGVQAYIDPEIIILGGSVAIKIEGFVEQVKQQVFNKVYPCVRPYVNIRTTTLNEDSGLLGAACLVFEKGEHTCQ